MVRTASFMEAPFIATVDTILHPFLVCNRSASFIRFWKRFELILETKFVPMTGQQSVS